MDIRQGKSKVATLRPSSPMTSPAAVIYDDQGAVLVASDALTATPSTVECVVVEAATNTRYSFDVDDSSDIEPGAFLQVTSAQWGTAISEVSAVDGPTVRLVEPLPAEPVADDPVRGIDVSVTIPPTATAAIGTGFVLEVTEGDASVHLEFAVCRYPFIGPCDARQVRAHVSRGYPGEYTTDERFHARVADEVNDLIRAHLIGAGEFISRYWNPKAFASVVPPMIRVVLSERYGLREGSATREEYTQQEQRAADAQLQLVLKSVLTRDKNMDGKLSSDEKDASARYSIEFVQ